MRIAISKNAYNNSITMEGGRDRNIIFACEESKYEVFKNLFHVYSNTLNTDTRYVPDELKTPELRLIAKQSRKRAIEMLCGMFKELSPNNLDIF